MSVEDIPALVETSALEEFSDDVQGHLRSIIGDYFMRAWLEKQVKNAQEAMRQFRRGDLDNEEYAIMFRDRQLLWRFWQDLLDYATNLHEETTAQLEGE